MPKSLPNSAGQFDLKGKKTAKMQCRCCIMENWREYYENVWAKKEMLEDLIEHELNHK